MSNSLDGLPQPLLNALACAALHPGLRSLLFLDATYNNLQRAAAIFVQMMRLATGRAVESATISAADTDDTLWGNVSLRANESGPSVAWQPGLLAKNDSADGAAPYRVIVIPDLSTLNIAAARACTVIVGADVAVLDRHGRHMEWQPNFCWVASCPSEHLGRVSTHLLDRFALRINGQSLGASRDAAHLLDWIAHDADRQAAPDLSVIARRIRAAAALRPIMTPEARTQLGVYLANARLRFTRREITFGRLAVSHARLDTSITVTAEHVDAAARMLGLNGTIQERDTPRVPKRARPSSGRSRDAASIDDEILNAPSSSSMDDGPPRDELKVNRTSDVTSFAPTALSVDPYPEDTAIVERDHASLQFPFPHTKVTAARGQIVGLERTTSARDLSIVGTILEAAKFQSIRRARGGNTPNPKTGLLFSASDLRKYRRAMVSDYLLVMVIDFTSIDDSAWDYALLPYLRWAYVKRAAVCVIQVGAAGARSELRAESVFERRVHSPRIERALESAAGKSSPLAHGLDLALQTLRHQMQHGDSVVRQAMVVVLSDGRGNVPLSASRMSLVIPPVMRQGIEDSLQVARELSVLRNVQSVLLNPQPAQYPRLPAELAHALNAELVNIPLRQDMPAETYDWDERGGVARGSA